MRKGLNVALLAVLGLTACGPATAPAEEAAAGQGNEAGSAEAGTGNPVVTSGKSDVPLDAVPAEVMAAARAARLGFTATEAESETRDGRNYYDIGGTLPDGSEIEFDIMEDGGVWRVVETQRDIAFAAAPEPVRLAVRSGDPVFAPTRVIESVQADGLTIYELYAEVGGDPQGRKVEVRWDGRQARVLEEEWEH